MSDDEDGSPAGSPSGGGAAAAAEDAGASFNMSLSMGSEVPSFRIFNSCFVKDDIAIHSKGVEMRDRKKSFTVSPEELTLGQVIGRGFSSYVQHAVHKPTGTKLALKVINAFEKVKRDQLVKEIKTLYDASSKYIVTFYGAFYRDGAISIALEYMDGGSLANVVQQVRAFRRCERVCFDAPLLRSPHVYADQRMACTCASQDYGDERRR